MAEKQSKNLTKLVLLGVAIAAAIFLVWRLNKGGKVGVILGDEVKEIAPVTIDSSVLSGQKFKNLRGYGAYPVKPGITGRENPFVEPTKQELKAMGMIGRDR